MTVPLATTALIVIDMQRDFLDPRGYIGQSGVDVGPLRTLGIGARSGPTSTPLWPM